VGITLVDEVADTPLLDTDGDIALVDATEENVADGVRDDSAVDDTAVDLRGSDLERILLLRNLKRIWWAMKQWRMMMCRIKKEDEVAGNRPTKGDRGGWRISERRRCCERWASG